MVIFVTLAGGRARHEDPIVYRARPDSTLCVFRLLQVLRYKNERITSRAEVFINDNGRKVNKNNSMMKELGRLVGVKDWHRLTAHGNRKKGVTDAAKASTGALHNKMARDHCRHTCEDSQKPYLKPGSEERAEFFNTLEGKVTVTQQQEVPKVGFFTGLTKGVVKGIKGLFTFGGTSEEKSTKREYSVQTADVMNENHRMIEFIKSEGLLEKWLSADQDKVSSK